MKILVIGSNGNIGRKLVPYLRSKGHTVLRADIAQEYAKDYVKCDINKIDDLWVPAIGFQPEVIYHMAAMVSRITSEEAAYLCIDTNISGTNNVCQLCHMTGAKMINFSTSEIYGNIGGLLREERVDIKPNNRYGLSKWLAENIVEYEVNNYDLKAVTVRPFMFYDEDETFGEHRSAMIRFAEALAKGEKITVHRNTQRSWLHMDDVAVALERCIHLKKYHVINIGSPEVESMYEIAMTMCKKFELDPNKYIELKDMPKQMTRTKIPCLEKQKLLLDFMPTISLNDGIDRVLMKVKERIERD